MQNSNQNHSSLATKTESVQKRDWLTDIDMIQAQIQAEIEKDLAKGKNIEDSSWETTESITESLSLSMLEYSRVDDAPEAIDAPFVVPIGTDESFEIVPKKRSWSKFVAVLLLVCIFGMGSLGFGLGAAYVWVSDRLYAPPIEEAAPEIETPPSITSNRYTFEPSEAHVGTVADMVELLEPAVVSITTRFEGNVGQPIAGSGTIFADLEDRIFIATGHYVVPANGVIHVRISGSRPIPANLVTSQRQTGLAVISIDKAQLTEAGVESYTIATFGDSSSMQVGDVVFAMGNARNEGISVTRGIISAGKQDLVFPDYSLTVLQTDAAINYGSSGGPLINLNGEVIGINIDRAVMVFGSAAIEGIGYSIASNVALPILEAKISPDRPALGITGRDINEEIAAAFGIPAMGVIVATLVPGGAADLGGMLPYDIITTFEGEPILRMDDLQFAILGRNVGEVVEIRILRYGESPITLEVTLQATIR